MNFALWKMGKATIVIAVQVCEDDSLHISRPNAKGA
jgi:hypothetical protein